jgi:hypothetical protein
MHTYAYTPIYKYFSLSIYIAGCLALLGKKVNGDAGLGVAEIFGNDLLPRIAA